LRQAGVEARIEELAVETPTADAAAQAVGCELGQIVKTIVLVCDGRVVLALVGGDRRASPTRVAELVGAKRARTASPDEVLQATGFVAGGVAPFPHAPEIQAFLDTALLDNRRVWIGAGLTHHLAGLAPEDLARVAHAEPASVQG
jgi:prolyl-tRNA editing enzyme YbaK/EbsC (Cys-tRNA(Pro) deacylase)